MKKHEKTMGIFPRNDIFFVNILNILVGKHMHWKSENSNCFPKCSMFTLFNTNNTLFPSNQLEAGTKLFPAVFVKPTTSNMFQFELESIKVTKLYQS